MAGLKICTRCRAISARRRRRISSSLLPENIGPTTTSIHPMLPFTISTRLSLLSTADFSTARSLAGPIHISIVERCEPRNHRQPERLLPRQEISRQHAPRALSIADANFPCEPVDSRRQFVFAHQDLFGQRLRKFDTSRTPAVPPGAIADVCPTLQKYPADSVLH